MPILSGRSMSVIAAKGLSILRDGVRVLHSVDLAIEAGEIVTIVGPNGSGKTTLLKALIGALPAAEGAVARQPGLRLGYVPQTLAVDRTLPITVARFLNLPTRRARDAITAAMETAGVPGLERRQLSDLSGGQFQRVLLARAVLERPHLLVLDEPTQGLDQAGSAAFYQQIEALRAELGCAVLMVSHDLHVVMSASDRVICLNGHVCCEGAPDLVASAPEYRALFGRGTKGALALYRHDHDHSHDHDHAPGHAHAHSSEHSTHDA